MNYLLLLTLSFCFSSFLALRPSSFLSENTNTSNISVSAVKVSYSNISGLSNFIVSCSSVPTQVVIVLASQNDFYNAKSMSPYMNVSRVLRELGGRSLYTDYRYYRVYAAASNSGSNLSVSLDLLTKHSSQEHLSAIAWCAIDDSFSSGYLIDSYGPFSNGGVRSTIKVTYSQPLTAEEVPVQASLLTIYLANYYDLSFSMVYDHFGRSILPPYSNEEKIFYIPDSNEYNTYLDINYFAMKDNNYAKLTDALNATNINQTLAGFNEMLQKQKFLPVALRMSVALYKVKVPELDVGKYDSTSNSVSIWLKALAPGKFATTFYQGKYIGDTYNYLSFWNGEDLYGNPLPNFRMVECNFSEDYQIWNYTGLASNTSSLFQYYISQPGPIQDSFDLISGFILNWTKSSQAWLLGVQIIGLLFAIYCLIN